MHILFRATIFFLLVLLLLPAAHAEAGTDSPFQRENHIETLAPEEDAPLEETKAIYAQCAHTYRENDLKAAERQRDAALNGNMPLLFAVYALTWLEEDSGRSRVAARPPPSGNSGSCACWAKRKAGTVWDSRSSRWPNPTSIPHSTSRETMCSGSAKRRNGQAR